MENPYWSNDD